MSFLPDGYEVPKSSGGGYMKFKQGANKCRILSAPVLGWDAATIENEIEHYAKRVEAERDSQNQLDDQTADAARLGAPEVRTGLSG